MGNLSRREGVGDRRPEREEKRVDNERPVREGDRVGDGDIWGGRKEGEIAMVEGKGLGRRGGGRIDNV
ncbi:UNVERIFIED_CONTAM: hypothetical protein Sradi_3176400 [Sesamum radiatum]|uniref:Uncharacterized protein n=1 Tax=Sesamum radiatum TaxID=300843 RepID=A0AAW2RFA6_SESRA